MRFERSSYSFDEASTATLMLMLSGKSSTDIKFKVYNNDTGAIGMWSLVMLWYLHCGVIGGDDYVSGPYNVTFPAGVTEVSLNVTIINDVLLEYNETFQLSININSSSLPNRVTVDNHNEVTVTIVDNDSKLIINLICST